MSLKYLIKICLITLLFQACNTSKKTTSNNMAYYDPDARAGASMLNLPIKLYKAELEKTINQQIGDVIFQDDDFSDGLMIKATRQADITLEIADQRVKYKVPITLWVKKDVMITSVDAEGSLDLEFETAYDVKPDWTLSTQTTLTTYEWTQTPVVKLGFGKLNVTSIANQFIEQAKGQLAGAIDDQVKKLIDLKSEINKAWTELQQPILVSEEYNTWLLMHPDTLRLTPLKTIEEIIETTVVITAKPKMSMGSKPTTTGEAPMPNFQYIDEAPTKEFSLYLGSEIPFEEAEAIAQKNMVGETYSYGKRKVKVENIEMYGKGNKLAINTTLSGSYNGDVLLLGKPEYHERKNEIVLKDVDFDFSTQKVLMKTATWLFKGSLKNTIEENLNFHLTENLEAAQTAIEAELENFELGPGMKILGNLDELNVSHVYVSTTGIHVKVGLSGKLALEVKDFMSRN